MMIVIGRDGRERHEEDSYVLQHGETYRVPMLTLDSTQRAIRDAMRQHHRPAYVRHGRSITSDSLNKVRAESIGAREAYLQNAWRSPASNEPASSPPKLTGDHAADREAMHRHRCVLLENAWKL